MLTIAKLREVAKELRKQARLANIIMVGKEYCLLEMHPSQHYALKVMAARWKYKHQRWVERFNKWRASRGESPYQEIEGTA